VKRRLASLSVPWQLAVSREGGNLPVGRLRKPFRFVRGICRGSWLEVFLLCFCFFFLFITGAFVPRREQGDQNKLPAS
jgi:hypothetical protein